LLQNELSKLISPELLSTISNKSKLILIPHDILHGLPWEAIEQLGLNIPIVRSYSLGLLSSCMKRELPAKDVLLIANPNFNSQDLNLAGADTEIDSIEPILKNKNIPIHVLKHENAKEPNFIEKMKQDLGIIHFAGHGTYDPVGQDPWLSGLLFHNPTGYDLLPVVILLKFPHKNYILTEFPSLL